MIQRIQTIYLLLIVLTVTAFLWINPVIYRVAGEDKWTNGKEGTIEVSLLNIDGKIGETQALEPRKNSYLIYSLASVGLVALVTIFMYTNRKMQRVLCRFNYLLIAAVGIFVYVYMEEGKNWVVVPSGSQMNYAVFGLAILLVFNFLALRGISRDDELIRSMDRIR